MLAPLPIDAVIPDLLDSLRDAGNAVLVAPPGTGKTTRVPPALAEAGILPASHPAVVMLQPRRVAARAAAGRIAMERGWQLGQQVGYHVRFDRRIGQTTRVRILTEGVLTRQILRDAFLDGVGCVILDEFHERGIHADLALALLREIQTTVRPDLRIVVMSATMDPGPVAAFLGGAPVLTGQGQAFPVTIEHAPRHDPAPVWQRAAHAARDLWFAENRGHLLVFLPGMRELRRTRSLLGDLNAEVHLLHGSVSAQAQDAALAPSEKRKLILATNIAETSLTIDGVTAVIDGGLARVPVHDTRFGFDRLVLRRISRASADQRAGRAGRTAPGCCLRLWTRAEDAQLEPTVPADIARIDLAATLLALRAYGVRTPETFGWFESPPPQSLERADALLTMLGAVDGDGLTKQGQRLARLPLHPRLACLLLTGMELGVAREVATLTALLSERDLHADAVMLHDQPAPWHGASDLLERLALFEQGRAPGMNDQAHRTVLRVRDELLRLTRRHDVAPRASNASAREAAVGRALLRAYPDRVTKRRAGDPRRGVLVGGRGVALAPSSVVHDAPFFLSLDARELPGTPDMRVTLAGAVDVAWLEADFPHLVRSEIRYRFDPDKQRVLSRRVTLFADLPLRESGAGDDADPIHVAECLCAHLSRDLAAWMQADEPLQDWLARIALLREQMPELGLPAFDDASMQEALRLACAGCQSVSQVRARGLRDKLETRLTWEQRAALDRHAPERLVVPSGSRIRLRYAPDGTPPVLAVRVQEMFGLADTPRVAGGRVPVLLHLLAPNQRAVQVTSDLAGFWRTTYPQVRKELRARYPKHPWPDDPLKAAPVCKGGRRQS